MQIKLNDIIIGERQRLELGDLTDLDSMADPEVGLIQPIVVHKTLQGFELVAGRRRLAKATALGWESIEAVEKDTLTVVQKNKMELFEDVGRKDRSWQDRCLSVAKLHYLMQAEKNAEGESWTTKHTSLATGYGAGAAMVRRMLLIAEILERQPKDEEAWNAENFNEAFRKCVVDRNERAAREELERRRAVMNKDQMVLPGTKTEATYPDSGPEGNWADSEEGTSEATSSQGYKVTPTAEMPSPTSHPKIYLAGNLLPYEKAVADEHYIPHHARCILAYDPPSDPQFLNTLYNNLHPDGWAMLWFSSPRHNLNSFINSPRVMPWRVVWNQVALGDSAWPFCENYGVGVLIAGSDSPKILTANPSASVITAMREEDGNLPFTLVVATLTAICPPNLAVICACNAPVVAVAEAGRVPIWYEADKEKFAKQVAALTAYYQENIPNAEVVLR